MRTHVEFQSTHFPPYPDEDKIINPNRYGKRLAEFLSEELKNADYKIKRVVSEDWGWIVELENKQFPLWIGCGNYEETENGFLCFIESSKPYIRRWFRRLHAEPTIERLVDAIETILKESGKVTNLRWWSEDEI